MLADFNKPIGKLSARNDCCHPHRIVAPRTSEFVYVRPGQTHLSPPHRIAFIGNSLPRRCGIATFTTDLQLAVAASAGTPETLIVAINDEGHDYEYPRSVGCQIREQVQEDYHSAARFLNAGQYDVVSLQHEFGIFGGEAGSHVLSLLRQLSMPVVTTLHTVLAEPSPVQRRVLGEIVDVSTTMIVMAEKGRELLRSVYDVPPEKIRVIPHGIPDCAFGDSGAPKLGRGFAGRAVILTFGLISPNKGIEIMIDAMPEILRSRPDAVYVVLGATHPNLVRREGEAYRSRLRERTRQLGIEEHVVFLDQFVDRATLVDFISMCDVYVTPYLNEAQMTSGTLAYSFGVGRPVVSTPYWHARELLADGRGILVPFGDSSATGREIAALLTDDPRRHQLCRDAYEYSRPMTWPRIGDRYMREFSRAMEIHESNPHRLGTTSPSGASRVAPDMCLIHFLSMCDDTGLLQHAIQSVPDRSHGYCVDDNARALLLACALNDSGEQPLSEGLTARLAAFVQHAWNPATRRFRNFMGFDRHWLEDSGSEDSHGRTLWALGVCARSDARASRRSWAKDLFAEAAQPVRDFSSPRAWAFTLLGLEAIRFAEPLDARSVELQHCLAGKLMALLSTVESGDWVWFEDGLAYDNARLPQALIATGVSTGRQSYLAAGLRSLRWLMALQTAPSGVFRPVGSQSFGNRRQPPHAFDQQPLEATASIAACLAAWHGHGDPIWRAHALRVFEWFLGGNDLSISLIDLETGSCCDGLHPGRANENRGGESVVSYLLGLAQIRQLSRFVGQTCDAGAVAGTAASNVIELKPRSRHLDTEHIFQ
jgi:glycosyltransferase involved in cell wall biosynthesis